jgi:adenylate cyclase
MLRRDLVRTAELAAETMTLSDKYQFPFLLGLSKSLYGWSLTQQGQLSEGIEYLLDGIEQYRQTGSRLLIHFHLAMLAEAYLGIQSFDEALAVLDEGLEFARHTNDLFYIPEVHRLKGDVLLAMGGKQDEAEHHFLTAAELARQQSARSWELRATLSLCKLWHQQHRKEEARAMLAPTLGWFKEGHDTPDVVEGFALLNTL